MKFPLLVWVAEKNTRCFSIYLSMTLMNHKRKCTVDKIHKREHKSWYFRDITVYTFCRSVQATGRCNNLSIIRIDQLNQHNGVLIGLMIFLHLHRVYRYTNMVFVMLTNAYAPPALGCFSSHSTHAWSLELNRKNTFGGSEKNKLRFVKCQPENFPQKFPPRLQIKNFSVTITSMIFS